MLRGDQSRIVVGARTSVQDGAVLHCTRELETIVGDDCTIGHLAHLEGCTVEDGALDRHRLDRVAPGDRAHRRARRRGRGRARTAWRCRAARWRSAFRPSSALDAVKPEQVTFPAQEYERNWARYRAEMRRIDGDGRTLDVRADEAADAVGEDHRRGPTA